MPDFPLPTFDIAACANALGGVGVRFDIDSVAECDSTNSRLMARAESGAPSGSVLVADRQNAGRGRRGREWLSAAGDSLTFSLLWRFPTTSTAPAALSLAVGVALIRGLAAIDCVDAKLKWPNDVLIDGRKLAGVLVELQPGDIRSAIVGIGINLRRPPHLPEELAPTVADLASAGVAASREALLAAILRALAEVFDRYGVGGFAALRDEWQAAHAWQGRAVKSSGDGPDLVGRCLGVDDGGALLLDTPAGQVSVLAGDVSLRLT